MNQTTRLSMSIIQDLTIAVRELQKQRDELLKCADQLADCIMQAHYPDNYANLPSVLEKYREVRKEIK